MKTLSFLRNKTFLIFGIALLSLSAIGQNTNQRKSKKNLPTELHHMDDYFKQHHATTHSDSVYFNAYRFLLDLTENKELKKNVSEIQILIDDNTARKQLINLAFFKKKVDSLNEVRAKFLADYWQYKESLNQMDSIDMAIIDSSQIHIVDSAFFQDSLQIKRIYKALMPYNDSLVSSINKSIAYFSRNEIVNWINEKRQDTVNFYIINLEGDSLLVHLYNNSPELVRFSITDLWGNKNKAVIRDIDKNSMRLLVDNTPVVNYETDEKAKEAIGVLGNNIGGPKALTLKKRPIEAGKTKWLLGGNTSIDLAQNYLSESWAKGGQSSLSFMTGLELFAIYKKGNYSFENKGVFKYGAMRQGGKDNPLKSTEDRIELVSKYGHKLFGSYFVSALFNFKSQFATGYEYPTNSPKIPVSKFMSPGYITFALGLDVKSIPKATLFISPITSKSTVVLSDTINETKYGLEAGDNVRHETGAIVKGSYKTKVWGNIEMENYLELFSNYVHNPQNIDIDWDFRLIFPVNDFIRATISTRLIYDDDQLVPKFKDENGERVPDGTTKAVQFKEYLTIGFAVKF
jgi:hypothetical protein